MIYQNALLHNVEELVANKEQGGYRILRLPRNLLEKLNPIAQSTAYFTCGCELRFNLNSPEAVIYLSRDLGGPDIMPNGIAEVWQGDFQGRYQLSPQAVGQEKTAVRIRKMGVVDLTHASKNTGGLFDSCLYRVLLPYDWGHAIYAIEGDISLPKRHQMPDKTLLCYGSSITHGGGVSVPSASYAFKLATRLGMDLRNLGLAGAAHMDEAMADYIIEQSWDMATMELGINVIHWTLEEFEAKAMRFIGKIAAAHPDRPIYCISLFTSIEDFKQPRHIQEMRKILKRIVEKLNRPKLRYIDGTECLPDTSGFSSDMLHPSNTGMEQITGHLLHCMK